MAKPDANPHLTRRQAENVRAGIKVGDIVDRLEKAVAGEIEMTPIQVQAAKILLDKTLPSLQATELRHPDRFETWTQEQTVSRMVELLRKYPALAGKFFRESTALVGTNMRGEALPVCEVRRLAVVKRE